LPPYFVSLWNVFAEETVKMRAGALFSSALSGGWLAKRAEKIFADFLPAAGKKGRKGDGKGIMRQRSGSGSQS
jgi:hypothetical protein